jgi:hypothetical protein
LPVYELLFAIDQGEWQTGKQTLKEIQLGTGMSYLLGTLKSILKTVLFNNLDL